MLAPNTFTFTELPSSVGDNFITKDADSKSKIHGPGASYSPASVLSLELCPERAAVVLRVLLKKDTATVRAILTISNTSL